MQTSSRAGARFSVAALWIALLPSVCGAQVLGLSRNVLTNRDIITLANAGFTEEFIMQTIATSRTKFDISADAMADLAQHGITEDIIRAMRMVRPPESAAAERRLLLRTENTPSGPDQPIRIFVEPSPDSTFLFISHPQTAEIMKTFNRRCPDLVVTARKEEATFTVVLERESGKWPRRANKMIVFDHSGHLVYASSKRELTNAVRDFCASVPSRLERAAR